MKTVTKILTVALALTLPSVSLLAGPCYNDGAYYGCGGDSGCNGSFSGGNCFSCGCVANVLCYYSDSTGTVNRSAGGGTSGYMSSANSYYACIYTHTVYDCSGTASTTSITNTIEGSYSVLPHCPSRG